MTLRRTIKPGDIVRHRRSDLSLFPVYEMRPLPANCVSEVFRFAGGKWLPDDGEWDLAFAIPERCSAYMVGMPYHRNIDWSWLTTHWTGYQSQHPRGNPWHYSLKEGATDWGDLWDRERHENYVAGRAAMDFVCQKTRCSNGISAERNLNDPYITAGLVRERESQRLVEVPERPHCMYCGFEWFETKTLREQHTW